MPTFSFKPKRSDRFARPVTEPLEPRRLFAIAADETLAEQLVGNIAPVNNNYSYGSPVVTWAGVNGATTYANSSDCSNFVTLLLMQAYGYSSSQISTWTGKTLPQAKDLYNAALADKGFTGFYQIANVQIGDVMFMKYLDSSTDTGHCVTFDSKPVLVGSSPTQLSYNVNVIDCTGSPHTSDTRTNGQTGVGKGTMRLYTDLSGNLIAYAWGTSQYSVEETSDVRPAIFAKAPVTAGNSFLSGGSQVSWNSSTHALAVTGATAIVMDPGASQQPTTTETGSSTQLLLMPGSTSIIHIAGLNISTGASAVVSDPNSGQLLLDVAANVGNGLVTVDSTSQLDLAGNDMIVHGGSLATITGLVSRGYNGGLWNGKGIADSSATADTTHLTALGTILNTTGTAALYPSFDGVTAGATDVLVRTTYYGDANLDGIVDGSDYTRLDNGYLHRATLSGWGNGDFNYDGTIDGSDFTLLDNAFNTQSTQLIFSPSAEIAKLPQAVVHPAVFSTVQIDQPTDSSNRKKNHRVDIDSLAPNLTK